MKNSLSHCLSLSECVYSPNQKKSNMNCSRQSRITGPMPQGSRHHRVFIGNIPYNATEEQLIDICEIAGPVVSFRLVLDRETGKPKGYGFCEYLDEETALSARRNLQGHWINGRQLRIDFAEKDKSREVQDHPAASNLGNIDPSTQYLAKMSREQLNEIITEMNALVAQNHPLAQQLLQRCPHLPQALSQAQTRLDMVAPQMMQVSSSSSVTKRALETTSEGSEEMNHRSKRQKLEQHSEKQTTQFLAEVESALLQQVMSLTPERISSLPLEEQQQVLHLQAQMLVN